MSFRNFHSSFVFNKNSKNILRENGKNLWTFDTFRFEGTRNRRNPFPFFVWPSDGFVYTEFFLKDFCTEIARGPRETVENPVDSICYIFVEFLLVSSFRNSEFGAFHSNTAMTERSPNRVLASHEVPQFWCSRDNTISPYVSQPLINQHWFFIFPFIHCSTCFIIDQTDLDLSTSINIDSPLLFILSYIIIGL